MHRIQTVQGQVQPIEWRVRHSYRRVRTDTDHRQTYVPYDSTMGTDVESRIALRIRTVHQIRTRLESRDTSLANNQHVLRGRLQILPGIQVGRWQTQEGSFWPLQVQLNLVYKAIVIYCFHWDTLKSGNGNRGGRGVFLVYPPPGRKFFENTPPLEILGQAAILFFKWEKNVKISLNLTRFRSI